MSDALFEFLTDYGAISIFLSAYFSCLLVPIPTSLMMLTGGAFIASGDLSAASVVASAFCGAVLGDQTGFFIGKRGGAAFLRKTTGSSPRRIRAAERARHMVARYGGRGVFFSTWLVAPLGPWVNFIAGATGLGWLRFSLWDLVGEAIWVSVYVGLGYGFATRIDLVASLLGNLVGLLAALAVALLAAIWIRAAMRT